MRTLSLVGPAPAVVDEPDDVPLVVPVPRAGRTPWSTDAEGTAWVPAALLLAAAGRCSCDSCCSELARSKARRALRPA